MNLWRAIALTLILSLATGAGGAYLGSRYVLANLRQDPPLHQILHEQLKLSTEQKEKLEGLETSFAVKRRSLEAEMRASNAELAQAYQEQHAFTPKVQAAIDRFHHAMGALQAESMAHVIAMRGVLTPEQAKKFDDTVVRSLTAPGS